jgi:NADH-quinone oxidoreductase subunit L
LFAAAPGVLHVVFWVGAATALFSAVVAAGEMDLKRVLAWSTSSHLGTMMLAIGLGGPLAATLQFVVHAAFKSALFLAAGIVDQHAGTRDLRHLRGLGYRLPVAALGFLLGALSLAGFQPFFFTSSDEVVVAAARATAPAAAYLMLVIVLLGGLYIARAGISVFAGDAPHSDRGRGERSLPMLVGMMALAIAAVLGSLFVAGVPSILPFGPEPETSWHWRLLVFLAGAAGLVTGGWHARRYHAASVLGGLPVALGRALSILTELPSLSVLALARGVDRIEHGFDAIARGTANFVWLLAIGSERLERQEFGTGGDRFAQAFQWSGEALRSLQSGRLYLYILGLFIWSLAVVIGGLAIGL